MVARRRVLAALDVDVPEQMDVALEEDIRVEIEQLAVFRNAVDEVGEQSEQGIGRAVGAFVGTIGELLLVQCCNVVDGESVLGVVSLNGLAQEGDVILGQTCVFFTESGQLHGEDMESEGLFGLGAHHQG